MKEIKVRNKQTGEFETKTVYSEYSEMKIDDKVTIYRKLMEGIEENDNEEYERQIDGFIVDVWDGFWAAAEGNDRNRYSFGFGSRYTFGPKE